MVHVNPGVQKSEEKIQADVKQDATQSGTS